MTCLLYASVFGACCGFVNVFTSVLSYCDRYKLNSWPWQAEYSALRASDRVSRAKVTFWDWKSTSCQRSLHWPRRSVNHWQRCHFTSQCIVHITCHSYIWLAVFVVIFDRRHIRPPNTPPRNLWSVWRLLVVNQPDKYCKIQPTSLNIDYMRETFWAFGAPPHIGWGDHTCWSPCPDELIYQIFKNGFGVPYPLGVGVDL